jgi:dTDP-4-dehydrorhamnose reductase
MKKNLKKSVLVLGASGLIGSTIYKYLVSHKTLEVFGTYSSNKPPFKNIIKFNFLKDDKSFLEKYSIIINCIGITKHNKKASNLSLMYNLNIKLPLILDELSKKKITNVIHISTDCVFSGKIGNYKENSNDFSLSYYGETKRIAEMILKNCLVIRTSTVGHEFFFKNGLLEWFLSQKKKCIGFNNAYFNGLTTLELSKIIYKYFIYKSFFPNKIINVGSKKISKYELLSKMKDLYHRNIEIEKDNQFKIDRTLDISKFINLTDYKPKTWYKMLLENKNYLKNV